MGHISPAFKLKKLALALVVTGFTMSSSYAVLTGATGTIQGTAPVLSAPSNDVEQAVDLISNSEGNRLASGDTITLKYKYTDAEGDKDASTAHVKWYYVKDGTETEITTGIVNVNAPSVGENGTSTLTIPAVAIGAERIMVTIQEYAASGIPINGKTIVIDDTNEGVGGGSVTPPGPVVPGGNVTPGIYLSSDTAFASNLIGTENALDVGKTYVFKLWDSNAVGTTDLTQSVTYNWRLIGTSASDGVKAPDGGFKTSVTGSDFTVPTNDQPDGTALTKSDDGAQGFNLAVDYN
ncbi:SinI family autotransporter-associated protein [Lelliottia nimipressuralis]